MENKLMILHNPKNDNWIDDIKDKNVNNKRGGARQGAGRPKKPETVVLYRKVTKEEKQKLIDYLAKLRE